MPDASSAKPPPAPPDWFAVFAAAPAVAEIANRLGAGDTLSARGVAGSSAVLLAAAVQQRLERPLLLVVAHLDEADEACEELEGLGVDVARLPAMEVLPGETAINLELLTERLTLVRRLDEGGAPSVLVAPIQALMQSVPPATQLETMLRVITPGDTLDVGELAAWLDTGGYRRVDAIEAPGEFAIRGGIVDVAVAGATPCRIDLFGDEVEGLYEIDLDTMGSDRRLPRLELVAATVDQLQSDTDVRPFSDVLPAAAVAMLVEIIELTEQGRSYWDRVADARGILAPPAVFSALQRHLSAVVDVNQFSAGSHPEAAIELPLEALPTFDESASTAVDELVELARETRTIVLCQNAGETQRLGELLTEHGGADAVVRDERYLHRGFVWHADDKTPPLALVPYHELLHRYHTRRRVRRIATSRAMDAFVDLQPGDYVVHRDHGIARFLGLRTLATAREGQTEFLTLEFAKTAKLNVPVAKIDLVQKYIGAFSGTPELSTLGGKRWQKQKEKVSEAVRDLAAEMLRLQAARSSLPGIRFPADTTWQREFEAEFPYQETEDQLAAIAAVKRDMADTQPMDRLVCGDVGFGKTEVAIRAAFKAAEFGKQVAVLVPTTVLADQHERTFRQRFADYPFRIETVSRFKTRKEQTAILEELKRGRVDVVIGTHRLLSDDVTFADLGLVIVDEEQRFGVEHKQKLLSFRTTADVMTLSATPIPRTLHMAILGLRDISSLSTPPLDRRAIVTELIPPNPRRLKQVIQRELAREGQIFYVHNRVYDIESVADDVQRMAPDARVIIGHGQMPARMLEKVMLQFIRGEADILVCTTIIESGIDIPTANTMIIDSAHMFGLSELHQLRGRVGRYKHRAYCYLVLPKDKTISEVALKRLQALESFSMLGAGFRIALRDLEIRGAGNLLGAEQSGHIAAVGYEMYCQLLEQEVASLKREDRVSTLDCVVDLGVEGSLPKGYIPTDARRMDAYRRICQATDTTAVEKVHEDLTSAYGDPPGRAEVLFRLAEIRIAATRLGIRTITRHDNDVVFRTARPRDLESTMGQAKGTLRMVGRVEGDGLATVYYRPPASYFKGDTLLTVLRARLTTPATETLTGV
ncbi:MAG: transcription-repair coupling factor [Phycisphaerae bacterium]|nr:transcription-repair coupling factor [Phycisphaerae bacterium]